MFRLERPCRRAYFERVQNGCVYFETAVPVEIRADFAYDFRTQNECTLNFGIDYEVKLSAAITNIRVGQSVLFFGERMQTLRKHFDMTAMHRNFTRLRLENVTLYSDDVAQIVIFFERSIVFLADVVATDVNLYKPFAVLNMGKRSLAHNTARHKSSGHTDFFAFETFEIAFKALRPRGNFVFYLDKGVNSVVGQFL